MLNITQYFGGKSKLLSDILPILESVPHRTYAIPFGGMANTLINKERVQNEFYNDIDDRVYNLLRVIRNFPAPLIAKLKLTPYCRQEFEACKPVSIDMIEDARRTFVLLTQGGNGRLSNPYWHKPSMGNPRQGNRPSYFIGKINNLFEISERLQGVYIDNMDALDMIRFIDSKDTLLFLDPPYTKGERTGARYRKEVIDHAELINLLPGLKSKIMICGYNNALYNEGLKEWNKLEFEAETRGSVGGKQTAKIDCVWFNFEYSTPESQEVQLGFGNLFYQG